jgi:hypothetical protein
MEPVTYTDVVKSNFDAGVFRTYLAQNHGSTFIYGAEGRRYFAAYRMADALAKLVASTREQIVEQAKVDFLVWDYERESQH